MPAERAERINRDVNRALQRVTLITRLKNLGNEPMPMSLAEFDQFVRKEVQEAADLAKAAGLKPQ